MSVEVNNTIIPEGKWELDPAHSEVGFIVRHAGISKVRGQFKEFVAVVNAGSEISDFDVDAVVRTASLDTGDANRDAHVKSPDFFDVENFPEMVFDGKELVQKNGEFKLTGDLTIRDVTKSVTFDVEFNGLAVDPFGNTRAGLEAATVISRKDFGLTWNAALETGGVLVGDKVTITLDLSFIKA